MHFFTFFRPFLSLCLPLSVIVQVRTWTPKAGPFHGFLITHNEAISIADYFTVKKEGKAVYRPTVHYAYHPCDDAVLSVHEFAGTDFTGSFKARLVRDDIVDGVDELGVLLMGHKKKSYWWALNYHNFTGRFCEMILQKDFLSEMEGERERGREGVTV